VRVVYCTVVLPTRDGNAAAAACDLDLALWCGDWGTAQVGIVRVDSYCTVHEANCLHHLPSRPFYTHQKSSPLAELTNWPRRLCFLLLPMLHV
jgi:hypothetical protein